jgi:hypothetical protein
VLELKAKNHQYIQ